MIVDAAEVAPSAWKNGGGRTRELLRWPAQGEWRLRLSLADIEADGPFSAFPGVWRWFVVVQGQGVELDLGRQRRRLRPGDAPLAFDGALAPACRLLGGPTRDLNLMLRGLEGQLLSAATNQPKPPGPTVGFFEVATLRLHWPFAGHAAPGAGWWIVVVA